MGNCKGSSAKKLLNPCKTFELLLEMLSFLSLPTQQQRVQNKAINRTANNSKAKEVTLNKTHSHFVVLQDLINNIF